MLGAGRVQSALKMRVSWLGTERELLLLLQEPAVKQLLLAWFATRCLTGELLSQSILVALGCFPAQLDPFNSAHGGELARLGAALHVNELPKYPSKQDWRCLHVAVTPLLSFAT